MNSSRTVMALVVCTLPLGALAQTPPTVAPRAPAAAATPAAAPSAEAQASFRRGVAALRASRFAEAVEALEASVAQRSSPPAIYNLGFAFRGLGRNREAVEQFERWLERPSRGATPAALATVRAEAARLRATLVAVAVTPADAAITVDGRPLTLREGQATIDPGHRVVEAIRDGYGRERRDETFAPGARVAVTLSPLPPAPVAPVVVAPAPVVAVAPPVAPPVTPHPRGEEAPRGRPWVLPVVIVGGVLVVAAGITAAVLLSNDGLVAPPAGSWGQLSTR